MPAAGPAEPLRPAQPRPAANEKEKEEEKARGTAGLPSASAAVSYPTAATVPRGARGCRRPARRSKVGPAAAGGYSRSARPPRGAATAAHGLPRPRGATALKAGAGGRAPPERPLPGGDGNQWAGGAR